MRSLLENCGWHVVSVKMDSMPGITSVDGVSGMGLTTLMSFGSVMCLPSTEA